MQDDIDNLNEIKNKYYEKKFNHENQVDNRDRSYDLKIMTDEQTLRPSLRGELNVIDKEIYELQNKLKNYV